MYVFYCVYENLCVLCFFVFLSRVNIKVFIKASGPASVNVLPKEKGKEGLNAAITARNKNSKPNVLQRK